MSGIVVCIHALTVESPTFVGNLAHLNCQNMTYLLKTLLTFQRD